MADQVTISTFLELRDNLSPALKRVADAVDEAFGRMPRAQSAANRSLASIMERDYRRRIQTAIGAEKQREREVLRAQQAMLRESQRVEKERQREKDRLAKDLQKESETINRAIGRALERRQRAQERAEAARVRTLQRAQAEVEKAQAAILRSEARTARAQIQEIRRVDRARAEAHRHHMNAMKAREEKTPAKKAGRGLTREIVIGDLIASGIKSAVSASIDSLRYFFQRGIETNVAYEKSVSAISASLYTMDISPSMRAAEAHTEKVLSTLRRLAAVLPGEAADYVEVYQRTVPAALMSGMKDTQKYAEFVSKYTAVAIQRGVGAKVAATNLQILLQGTARAGTKMAQVLSAYTGKTINDLNKMSRAARFEILQGAVDQAASGMEAAMDKFDAVYGTFKTNMEDMFRLSAKPLFEDVKGALKDINAWFDKNKTAVIELGTAISDSIGSALLGALDIAKELFEKVKGTSTTLISQMTPEQRKARLKELQKAGTEPNLRDLIPGYGLYKRMEELGEIDKITDAIAKDVAETKKYSDANKRFRQRLKELDLPSTPAPTGTVEEMAFYAANLMRQGMFTYSGMSVKDAFSEQMTEVFGISPERAHDVWQEMIRRRDVTPAVDTDLAAAAAPAERARTYNDFRHSNFNIKQEFAEGFDPDRIAFAFANDLSRLGEMKLQAAYSLTGGSVR